jgi:hypothetical protein
LTALLMKEEFNLRGPVPHLLLRYTQALMTQMVQTAACNKHHSLDQQLCRWLLLSLDRLQGTEMLIRVLDRKGLEKRVCECYAVVRREYDRLLPDRLAA